MKYFEYVTCILLILLSIVLMSSKVQNLENENQKPEHQENENILFSFGVIADCQYKGEGDTNARKYSQSSTKLKEAVEHFNSKDLSFTMHLGDFIDTDWDNFDVVGPIYNELKSTHYHLLGNHDFSVPNEKKSEVYKKLNMPSEYYDFTVKDWRFIVLNGNDISFYAYPEGSEKYNFAATYYEQNELTSPKYNGGMGETQKEWLKGVLEEASKLNEKVLIFNHFPIYPAGSHNLWNDTEIIQIIESYPCVKAYMNGHNHAGNYGIINKRHYLTFKSMVDTEQNSYAIVEVYQNRLEVKGYGREKDRLLPLFE